MRHFLPTATIPLLGRLPSPMASQTARNSFFVGAPSMARRPLLQLEELADGHLVLLGRRVEGHAAHPQGGGVAGDPVLGPGPPDLRAAAHDAAEVGHLRVVTRRPGGLLDPQPATLGSAPGLRRERGVPRARGGDVQLRRVLVEEEEKPADVAALGVAAPQVPQKGVALDEPDAELGPVGHNVVPQLVEVGPRRPPLRILQAAQEVHHGMGKAANSES